MTTELWKCGKQTVSLTDESPASNYGFMVLRIEDEFGTLDCGPADYCLSAIQVWPQTLGTAAELLVAIDANQPLSNGNRVMARRFLRQWPDGPQL